MPMKPSLTDEVTTEAIRLYEAGGTIKEVAEQLGTTFSKVQRAFKRKGYQARPSGSRETVQYVDKPCQHCGARMLHVKPKKMFCSYACSGDSKTSKTHPNLITDFFTRWHRPNVAYWLGFCWGDGSVVRQSSGYGHQFRLTLAIEDEPWLDKFIATVGANPEKKTRHFSPPNGLVQSSSEQVTIQLRSRLFSAGLLSVYGKRLKAEREAIPQFNSREALLAFALGYFDADGTSTGQPTVTFANRLFAQDYVLRLGMTTTIQDLGTYWRACLNRAVHREMQAAYLDSLPRKRR